MDWYEDTIGSTSKGKGIGEQVADTSVKTTRAFPAASATAEEVRKRKVGCGGELSYSTSLVQLRSHQRRRRVEDNFIVDNLTANAAATDKSDDPCASCCSSNGLSGLDNDTSESIDLKAEEEEEEGTVERTTATYELDNCCRERREAAPRAQPGLGEPESTNPPRPPSMSSEENSSRSRPSMEEEKKKMKIPSKSEIEEFLSAAEKEMKEMQKKCREKYMP